MSQWEYEVRQIQPTWNSTANTDVPLPEQILEEFLNGMDSMGWEFVTFAPHPLDGDDDPRRLNAIFRRLKKG